MVSLCTPLEGHSTGLRRSHNTETFGAKFCYLRRLTRDGCLPIWKTQLPAVSDTLCSIRPQDSDDESPLCKTCRAASPVVSEVSAGTTSSTGVSISHIICCLGQLRPLICRRCAHARFSPVGQHSYTANSQACSHRHGRCRKRRLLIIALVRIGYRQRYMRRLLTHAVCCDCICLMLEHARKYSESSDVQDME